MPKRDRFADIALGLVVGLGIDLLFLVWTVPGFRNPTYTEIGHQHADKAKGEDEKPVQAPSFWRTYTTPQDTYAQWIMAALSFFATGISVWAVWLVRDTLEENRRATLAAEDAVALSRNIGIAQTRAFVFCERFERQFLARKEDETILHWSFIPAWRNAGNTPTKGAISCVNSMVSSRKLPDDFDFSDYGPSERIMIGPGAIMHANSVKIPLETMQSIYSGSAHAYIWGWIEYRDIYPETPLHRAEFCVEVECRGNPIYREFEASFRLHGPFNGFDEDCYRGARDQDI
jgi:hypothetical protein